MASVICTVPMVVPRSLAILEKAGRYISMANGPNADMTPKVHASFRAKAGEGTVFDSRGGSLTGRAIHPTGSCGQQRFIRCENDLDFPL